MCANDTPDQYVLLHELEKIHGAGRLIGEVLDGLKVQELDDVDEPAICDEAGLRDARELIVEALAVCLDELGALPSDHESYYFRIGGEVPLLAFNWSEPVQIRLDASAAIVFRALPRAGDEPDESCPDTLPEGWAP